ncbi:MULTISPECIES: hypothetical protein [unclassified Micromonospora]|uniref:hypothetical protein n=1 Tax=unclassified Micromonospora TaxID=2617518 RepID=UPI00098CF6DA|nr:MULTISPECIES: hypothetical protein [unclassified Micromonospora]MDI5936962.1 hypothetical protein [Micromonospora sp. DH15]OON30172.1 hypothetical protein BSA16_17700 [Micromonospora sp. Rc5]
MKCKDCGKNTNDIVTTSRGPIARCACGGWTKVNGSTGVTISGGITVTGTCAIGPGAVAIGTTDSKKAKKKGRR